MDLVGYFLYKKKKHRKNKSETNKNGCLQWMDRNGVEGIKMEARLLSILIESFDF